MIVTTTPSVEGRRIAEYLGLVTGEVIPGANVVRDFFASVRDVVGGRSGAYLVSGVFSAALASGPGARCPPMDGGVGFSTGCRYQLPVRL